MESPEVKGALFLLTVVPCGSSWASLCTVGTSVDIAGSELRCGKAG